MRSTGTESDIFRFVLQTMALGQGKAVQRVLDQTWATTIDQVRLQDCGNSGDHKEEKLQVELKKCLKKTTGLGN